MSELVPLSSRPGSFERLDRLEEIAAGQYWRSAADISEASGSPADGGRVAVPGGTVLLVKSLRLVDGELHTVILAPHPSEKHGRERWFLSADFFQIFVRELDPASVRRAEIKTLEDQIGSLQSELIQGPADISMAALPPPEAPTVGMLIAHADRADEIKQKALVCVENSRKKADWIQTKVAALGICTETLARYHAEQAAAALAAVEDTLRHAENLQKGVQSLGLYTGDGVEVLALCSGEAASGDEPLTLYQRKLFMDEEWLAHLEVGGGDGGDIEDFGAALAADRTLLDRILPMPRSVVLMAYRRHQKTYFTEEQVGDSFARAYANSVKNEGNFDAFLLIRNGSNVYQVFSDLATRDASFLFPTQDEIAKVYKKRSFFGGVESTDITVEDIRFTDARRKHDDIALFYRRLLIVLWGLDTRLNLFGDFYDRSSMPSWLSLGFQQKHFKFVHDAESVLTEDRPRFDQWIRTCNKDLAPGSRIVANWQAIMTPESAPYAVKYRPGSGGMSHNEFIYQPEKDWGMATAQRKDREIVVSVPCVYNGWRSISPQRKNISIDVSVSAYQRKAFESDTFRWLCLDRVTSEDIDWYLNSRRDRVYYLSYVQLFREVRKALAAEEEEARPFFDALLCGALDAKLGDEQSIRAAIKESIRMWRAARGGRRVPVPGAKDYRRVQKAVGQNVHHLLKPGSLPIAEIERVLSATGRQPIRLVQDGTGQVAVYAVPAEDETLLLSMPQPWAARIELAMEGSAISLGAISWRQMQVYHPAEAELHGWGLDAEWCDRDLPYKNATYEELKNTFSVIEKAGAYATMFSLERDLTLPECEDCLLWLDAAMKRRPKRDNRVARPNFFMPFAVVLDQNRRRHHVLAIRMDILKYLGAYGGEAGVEAANEWVRVTYKHPESHLVSGSSADLPCVSFMHLEDAAASKAFQSGNCVSYTNENDPWTSKLLGRVPPLDALEVEVNDKWSRRASEHENLKIVYVAPWAEECLNKVSAREVSTVAQS